MSADGVHFTKCAECGISSTLQTAFRSGPTSDQQFALLCPSCWSKRATGNDSYFFKLAIILAGISLLIWASNPILGIILLGGVVVFFFWFMLTVLHELAHAVAAALMGLRVYAVVIGWYGKTVFRFRFKRCEFTCRGLSLGGLTLAAHPSPRHIRLKEIVFVAAGPFLHVFLIGLAVAVVGNPALMIHAQLNYLVFTFLITNIVALGWNLFPFRYSSPMGPAPSDGLALLELPFKSTENLQRYHSAYFGLEAQELRRNGDYQASVELCEKGIEQFPDDEYLLNCYGICLLDIAKYEQAKRVFERQLKTEGISPEATALMHNNIAWADLFIPNEVNREQAGEFSHQAFMALPWIPEVKGTRGSVLIELGEIDDGIILLQQAFEENEDSANKAFNAAFLAFGFIRKGMIEEAQQMLKAAEELDAPSSLLERVRKELAEAGANTTSN